MNATNGRYTNTNGYLRIRLKYSTGSVASATHAAIVEASSRAPRSHAHTGRHIRRVSLIETRSSSETSSCETITSVQN